MDRKFDMLKFKSIMLQKQISAYDIQLSTGLSSSIVLRVIETGEGTIDDINKVLGCLNANIEECIDQDAINVFVTEDTNVRITEIFKHKSIISQIHPEKINLTKSFKGETQKRYVVRLYPLEDMKDEKIGNPIYDKLKKSKCLSSHIWKTPDEAVKEFKEQFAPKLDNLQPLYPEFNTVEATEIEFGTEELLLEYYNITFDPLDNNHIHRIGRVYPIGNLNTFNNEYMKKVYATCTKPKANAMKSKIYSQEDLDFGKLDDHLNLMKLLDVPTIIHNTNIIEFIVPHRFEPKQYYIETNNIYNDFERLKFNIVEY